MIKLEKVFFKYDKVILDNIDLEINKNKITCILGTNGSGKSTLANIMSGLLYLKKGKISIDDIEINKKIDNKIIRKKIGMVFQNPSNQILFSKVYDDLKFTLENTKLPKDKIDDIIKNSLKKVDMIDYIESNPYNLSGGEKQRIAIASQLSLNPDYLVLDEATSQLDINGKKSIYKLIKRLKKDMGIIFITNDINEIIYADEVVIIDKTKVYKYDITNIVKENSILTKHRLDIPFMFKIASLLNIDNISEESILESIKK